MKMVELKEFLKLPAGTVYAKYERCILSDICVKYTDDGLDKFDWNNDWWYASFDSVGSYPQVLLDMEKNNAMSVPLEIAVHNDGFYEDKQLFMIYEKEDINSIIDILQGKWDRS